jgi:TonB-dependent starch-binding outer membrane protein SusC
MQFNALCDRSVVLSSDRQLRRRFTKTLLVMKLTFILLTAAALHVSAKGTSQTVTFSGKDVPLEKVFSVIKEQTGYVVFFDYSSLEGTKPVSLTAKDVPLKEFLDQALHGQSLGYSIKKKTIFITKLPAGIAAGMSSDQQVRPTVPPSLVKGIVKDAEGNPLVGATVLNKNTNASVPTDASGGFSINASEGDVLVVSFVGYTKTEIKITSSIVGSSDQQLSIALEQNIAPLDETIIRAYGTTTRKFNTGNISKVRGADIQKQPIGDPILALQGRVAGLQISQYSGIPGGRINIRLRGQNSLRLDANSPLFILDGIPFPSTTLTNTSAMNGPGDLSPFSSINMDDIESIEVLKDADATAIYGSRGANGVILITTKKGRPGKTKVTANISAGAGKVGRKIDLLNTQQYLQIRRETFNNDNMIPQSWDRDLNGDWDSTRYTDWQKLLIGNTAHVTNAQASISGGTNLTQFLIGGTYRKETTVFPGDFNDKKSSVYVDVINRSENKKLNSQLSASYTNDNNLLPVEDFTKYIFLIPSAPALYDANGNLNWQKDTWNNPYSILYRKSKSVTTNLIGNLNVSYTLLPGLDVKAGLGYNKVSMNQDMIYPLSSYSPSAASLTQLRKHIFGTNNITTWNIEPQINYIKQVSNGKLEALIGLTLQETINESIAQTAIRFPSDALINNIAAAGAISVNNNNYSQYRYNALFGRVGYIWKERYLINLTGRRDGSTRFGPKKQFGNFGAIGAGWIFSNEKFIQNSLSFLTYGKIRGSYGTTGNDRIPDYQYLSTYSVYNSTYLGAIGLYPTQIANPYFGWETVKKLEFGLELGFLNDRILLSSSYYKNRTDDQLVGYSLPDITGFSTVQANLPAVIQNKGLEFEINTSNIKNSDFNWTTSFNISFPQNKLVRFDNLKASSYASRYEVGRSLFIYKGYHYLGIDPQTGVQQYEDINGDGIISLSADRVATKEISQKYFGGLNNSFFYKGFSLDVFIQFAKQTGYIYLWNGFPGDFFSGNQPSTVLDRWKKPGDNTDIQKLTQNYSSSLITALSNFTSSDGQIGDASFIRIKNISLSYSLPHTWLQKLKLTESKIFINWQNPFTITSYKGLDPETTSVTNLPPLKMVVGGIKITL